MKTTTNGNPWTPGVARSQYPASVVRSDGQVMAFGANSSPQAEWLAAVLNQHHRLTGKDKPSAIKLLARELCGNAHGPGSADVIVKASIGGRSVPQWQLYRPQARSIFNAIFPAPRKP